MTGELARCRSGHPNRLRPKAAEQGLLRVAIWGAGYDRSRREATELGRLATGRALEDVLEHTPPGGDNTL